MLVLSRKVGEVVVVGDRIKVTVLAVRGDRVRLGFQGPKEVPIHRKELADRLEKRPPVTHSTGDT